MTTYKVLVWNNNNEKNIKKSKINESENNQNTSFYMGELELEKVCI